MEFSRRDENDVIATNFIDGLSIILAFRDPSTFSSGITSASSAIFVRCSVVRNDLLYFVDEYHLIKIIALYLSLLLICPSFMVHYRSHRRSSIIITHGPSRRSLVKDNDSSWFFFYLSSRYNLLLILCYLKFIIDLDKIVRFSIW